MDRPIVLERGAVSAEVRLDPLRVDVRRDGRRLLRSARAFAVATAVQDRFVQVTEGVIAHEEHGPREYVATAEVRTRTASRLTLVLRLDGGRSASLGISLRKNGTVDLQLRCTGALRLAIEWDRRDGEHFAGLGARHHPKVDHADRSIQLGADRRYLGPDCPPEMVDAGGIPQGDYAPVPWLQSSRGYAVWCRSESNGVRFEMTDAVRVFMRHSIMLTCI